MERQRVVAKLITDGDNLPFRAEAYSEFKHGSVSVNNTFAADLTSKLYDVCQKFIGEKEFTILVYSAPYNKVPVASTYLARSVKENLERLYKNTNLKFIEGKVSRDHSYGSEYGDMNAEDREAILIGDGFRIENHDELNNSDLILAIDDIYITGAHERRMLNLLDNYDKPVIMGYYALLQEGCCEPNIEAWLNLNAVANWDLFDFLQKHVIDSDNLVFNTRNTKYFLSKSRKHIILDFCAKNVANKSQIFKFVEGLLTMAERNGYHKHESYSDSYDELKNV